LAAGCPYHQEHWLGAQSFDGYRWKTLKNSVFDSPNPTRLIGIRPLRLKSYMHAKQVSPTLALGFESVRPQIVLWHIHWFEIQRLVRACVGGEQFHDFINRFCFDSKGEQDSTCLFSRRVLCFIGSAP
jgi:hypothetical protein